MYKSLGRATGMDVDAIEKKAQADKAAPDAGAVASGQPSPIRD